MKKCNFCGISEEKTILNEGISTGGIIYVCNKCSFKSNIPLIEKKDLSKINFNQREKVRERLLKMSNIKKEDYNPENPLKSRLLSFNDVNLRKIVDENFKKNIPSEKAIYSDLIPNFNWIIMRARRIKKISKEQFAKDILEPILAIESLERGVLPKDYSHLIKKTENYLGISLFKDKSIKFDASKLLIESKLSNKLTVLDFKKIAEREKFDEELDKKVINPDEITMEKIEEISGKPLEDSAIKKKKGFFSLKSISDFLFKK